MENEKSQSKQSHKRPKSNLEVINNYKNQLMGESADKHDPNEVDDGKQKKISQSNPKTHQTSTNDHDPSEQKKPLFTFQSSNPTQMITNCVTKFAFATKTGMAPSNPNKTN